MPTCVEILDVVIETQTGMSSTGGCLSLNTHESRPFARQIRCSSTARRINMVTAIAGAAAIGG